MLQANMPKAKYEYFDFHTECKNMRWDRISVLIAKLEEDLIEQGSEPSQMVIYTLRSSLRIDISIWTLTSRSQ